MDFLETVINFKTVQDVFDMAEKIEPDDPDAEIKAKILSKEIWAISSDLIDLVALATRIQAPAGRLACANIVAQKYEAINMPNIGQVLEKIEIKNAEPEPMDAEAASKPFFDFIRKKVEANPEILESIKTDIMKFGLAMAHYKMPEPFSRKFLKGLANYQMEAFLDLISASREFREIMREFREN